MGTKVCRITRVMASSPKKQKVAMNFQYFDVLAKGLQPVLCLEISGLAWEGGPPADWAAMKPNTPFGQMPVLTDGQVTLAQSIAICNYIGKKADMLGANDAEFGLSQMLMAEGEDLYAMMQKYVPTVFVPLKKKLGQEGYDKFWAEIAPKH